MTFNSSFLKSDTLGAAASALCMVHCIATPLLFVAQTCSVTASCCDASPTWWKSLDYIFLVVSFWAVYRTTSNMGAHFWVKPALWTSWGLLAIILLNEKLALIQLPEQAIYVPALALVGLHLFSLRYCRCADDECCVPAAG
ncbi:MAG: MerC domain-containing protein [Phaeodactylibacter sp.]|nr:MerC domain-containing protein [Phaeodactylibacter sp.]